MQTCSTVLHKNGCFMFIARHIMNYFYVSLPSIIKCETMNHDHLDHHVPSLIAHAHVHKKVKTNAFYALEKINIKIIVACTAQ